jgi:hypothetical protein
MDVIRHNFQAEDLCAIFSTDTLHNLLKARINTVDQHETTVFQTPDHMVFTGANDIKSKEF